MLPNRLFLFLRQIIIRYLTAPRQ